MNPDPEKSVGLLHLSFAYVEREGPIPPTSRVYFPEIIHVNFLNEDISRFSHLMDKLGPLLHELIKIKKKMAYAVVKSEKIE